MKKRMVLAAGALALVVAFSPLAVSGQHDHAGHDHGAHSDEGHSDEVVLSEEAMRLFGIKTERAGLRTLSGVATVPARVSYNTEAMAHIGTQAQGRVQEIPVRLGDEVREGDLLLVINSLELGAAQSTFLQGHAGVEAARTNVEAAQAMVEVARMAFERAEQLRESNSIAVTEYLERQGALREAEANVRRAEAELRVAEAARQAAENQLHIYGYRHEDCDALLASGEVDTRYEVRAPIAGRVVEREVTPGEVVDPTDEALMVLANMEELWVLGDVPERQIGRVTVGTPARVTVGGLGDLAFEGTVSYIAPQLDARTRTATVRIVVPSEAPPSEGEEGATSGTLAGGLLKPGMFGQAELQLAPRPGERRTPAVAVPEEALQDVDGGPALFVPVPGEPNAFVLRPVRTGPRVGRWVPILSGLKVGERYVAENTFILKAELGKEGASHGHAH